MHSVSPGGSISSQHDLRVSGFMNYRQRQAYAMEKSNGRLVVNSPRSLLRKSTDSMYLPRNNKFEGYSQFPRPRLPPEAKKFDSFITRTKPKKMGDIYKGEVKRDEIPIKELLEMQAKRREE